MMFCSDGLAIAAAVATPIMVTRSPSGGGERALCPWRIGLPGGAADGPGVRLRGGRGSRTEVGFSIMLEDEGMTLGLELPLLSVGLVSSSSSSWKFKLSSPTDFRYSPCFSEG